MPRSLIDDGTSAGQDLAIGPDADKGIAADFFAAFDRFKQKRLRLVGSEPQKGGDGRFEVGGERAVDRDQGVRCRQAAGIQRAGAKWRGLPAFLLILNGHSRKHVMSRAFLLYGHLKG